MFRAQTRIFGLLEDWRIEWTASRVSDLRIRIRGIWGVGELEFIVGGSTDGGVAVWQPLEGDEGEPAVGLGEVCGVGLAPLG